MRSDCFLLRYDWDMPAVLAAQAGAGGGGVFINSNPASPTPSWPIIDSTVLFNCTSANGGGVYVQYSAVNITNSHFQFCSATQPGAGRGGALVGQAPLLHAGS